MGERRWEIGICGTFDVANYGDLLFPLIAESELAERLGAVHLHRFSYHGRVPPEWPYEVTSVADLPEIIHRLDGLLIGGGFLVRFDKWIAPEYFPPVPEIHHPTGYWLTPALVALQHNVPLVWNAPGMHCNEIPAWAEPLLERALTLSQYISVRDEPSQQALQALTDAPVTFVPDTAFRLPRLLDLEPGPSAEFRRLAGAAGLEGPYIVIQASQAMEAVARFLARHRSALPELQYLALPIGPVLGDRDEWIDAVLPEVVRLAEWPSPLALAELIGRSEAAIGNSYHLMITALACGVPVFTRQSLSIGKYTALAGFDTIFAHPWDAEPDPEWFAARVGRRAPGNAARAACETLEEHWDRIAEAIRTGPAATAPALNRFWQALPDILESGGQEPEPGGQESEPAAEMASDATPDAGAAQAEPADTPNPLDEALAELLRTSEELAAVRAECAAREARIAELMASASWRVTTPLRFFGRILMKFGDGN